jgi:hypothetical protein
MNANPPRRPSIAQVLLGLFVVWQLLFLFAANLVAFVPHGEPEEGELSDTRVIPAPKNAGPVQESINLVGAITHDWEQLTGQVQVWSLFAPEVPDQAPFAMVELRWDDPRGPADHLTVPTPYAPVRLRSYFEPEDLRNYFRIPSSFDRLFHYEVRLGLIYVKWNEQSLHEIPETWRSVIEDRVRRQWRSIRAFLRLRSNQFLQQHPELPPPRQVLLIIRLYRAPGYGQDPVSWSGPYDLPLARWLPESDSSDSLPVEMCDPVTGVFISLQPKQAPRHE